ncbi:uncharacterized protein LOC124129090 [Haliotis rufescens]|uniref:uncharacterized protein LOC124129090 n=1 Tax=Haliotis rufescens TaxID=6454 RepID=UPI00201EB1BE|nr:uncharacterized protein LOC124129090 [Haliotis rufescens]
MSDGFNRIIQQLGYEKQFTAPNCARVTVPGLTYTSFDGHASPQPWSVVSIIHSSQIDTTNAPEDGESILGLHHLFGKNTIFVVVTKVLFYDRLYDEGVAKAPLCMDTSVSNVGRSTVVIDTVMTSGQIPLAKYQSSSIIMDRTHGNPVEIPQQWKSTYGHLCQTGEPMRFRALERPTDQSCVSKVSAGRVSYSDTDANRHLNFSNYLRFCYDGFISGYLRNDRTRFPRQSVQLKSAFAWYRKQCYYGDDLELEFWEHQTKPGTFCVDMLRNGESVYQCLHEFYNIKSIRSSL